MQGYANPQNLNRFSYVLNNPVRFIDPTGHRCVSTGPGDCLNDSGTPINGAGGLGGGGSSSEGGGSSSGGGSTTTPVPPSPSPTPAPIPASSGGIATQTVDTILHGYCGGGPNGWYNFFDCGANITQDWALAIDTPFAGLEVVLITTGCFAGLEGCVAGAGITDTIFNVLGANADETALSLISAGFSVAADFADDGHLGQSSAISGVAAVGGFFSPDPILDFAINGFGSAYNHEVNPIYGIFTH